MGKISLKEYLSKLTKNTNTLYINLGNNVTIRQNIFKDIMVGLKLKKTDTLDGLSRYDYVEKQLKLLKEFINNKESPLYREMNQCFTNYVKESENIDTDFRSFFASATAPVYMAEEESKNLMDNCTKSIALIDTVKKDAWSWPFSSHNIYDIISKLSELDEKATEERKYLYMRRNIYTGVLKDITNGRKKADVPLHPGSGDSFWHKTEFGPLDD